MTERSARGRDAVSRLEKAARAGLVADEMMGFKLRPNKLESFDCNVEQREALMEHADLIGAPQTDFVLQARWASGFRRQGRRAGAEGEREANKAGGCQHNDTCETGSLLMISKFRFRSPWTRCAQPTVRDWTAQVEAAVWGGPLATGRSAFLLWTFVGVDLNLDFAIIVTVLIRSGSA